MELFGKCFKTFLIQVWLDAQMQNPQIQRVDNSGCPKVELKMSTNFVTPLSPHLQSKTTSFGICENQS